MERKTHFEHVVGGTSEQRRAVLKELQDIFVEKNDRWRAFEIKKTPEDLGMIAATERIVDGIVEEFGGTLKPFPTGNIHLVREGAIREDTEGDLAGGLHSPLSLRIAVERHRDPFSTGATLAHELFHLKSFKSARVGKSEQDVRLYRSGLNLVDREDREARSGEERVYFDDLEEAVVAECTRLFVERAIHEEDFAASVSASNEFRQILVDYLRENGASDEALTEFIRELKYIPGSNVAIRKIQASGDNEDTRKAYAAGYFKGVLEREHDVWFERRDERERMYKLLDEIVAKSEGKFTEREEVFAILARSNFSGNFLPFARVVEGALGPGSFRRIAEEFSTKKAQKPNTSHWRVLFEKLRLNEFLKEE